MYDVWSCQHAMKETMLLQKLVDSAINDLKWSDHPVISITISDSQFSSSIYFWHNNYSVMKVPHKTSYLMQHYLIHLYFGMLVMVT